MTKRQKQILDFIHEFTLQKGYAPSYREIAGALGLTSVATIAQHIKSLKGKKLINSQFNRARAIEVVARQSDFSAIPLLGTVAAGFPIEAIETRETLMVPPDMTSEKVYALKVRGDSMKDEGVLEGDYVIVEQTENPQNGEMVIALLDNENVTLKRFFKETDHFRLQPSNPLYGPIRTKQLTIQGRVIGVIRKYTRFKKRVRF